MGGRVCFCGQDEDWHKENNTHHAFFEKSQSGGPGQLNDKEKKKVEVTKGFGGDPALRMALIDAGVLSYEQLALAEEKLRAAREGGTIAHSNTAAGPGTTGPADSVAEDSRSGD